MKQRLPDRSRRQQSPPNCLLRVGLLLLVALLGTAAVKAQAPIISYPTAARDLTRGYSQDLLTVKLVFNGVCSGTNTVRVALPESITYVAGSLVKTGGTAAVTITESSIADPRNPVFLVSGISTIGDELIFTIARQAGCGSLATAKDSVYFRAGVGCSDASEVSATVNVYNIFAPALSVSAPAAVSNAVIDTSFNRSITVTNGGNGDLDTLHYYVVYTDAGVINTHVSKAITANSVSFSPVRSNGDTLFYKIYGSSVFGADQLLSSGETVTIIEPVRVKKCNASTSYGARWGRDSAHICQTATAIGSISMAAGVTNLVASISEPVRTGACSAPGTVEIVYTNNGSGAKAGTVYNINLNLGFNFPGSSFFNAFDAGQDLSNYAIKAVSPIALTVTPGSSSRPDTLRLSQLTADPDGAGVGLDDLDGDGQYDDLAPGKSFTLTMNRLFLLDSVNCPRRLFDGYPATSYSYTSMCGTVSNSLMTTNPSATMRGLACCINTTTLTPPQAIDGQPFNVSFSFAAAYSPTFFRPTDSLELIVILPPGVSYAGNAQYKGTTADYAVQIGQELHIYKKMNGNSTSYPWVSFNGIEFSYDLVYTCGSTGPLTITNNLRYVINRSCGAVEKLICESTTMEGVCFPPCPAGISNRVPVAIRRSMGWTDMSMTTKVNPDTLSDLSLATVTNFDTLNISSGGVQGGTTAVNNIYYKYELGKAAGMDLLEWIGGTFNYRASGSSTVVSCPVSLSMRSDSSTTTLTKQLWNLSSLLGSGCGIPAALNAGDSVWVDFTYKVNNANNGQLLGLEMTPAKNMQSFLFNLNTSGAREYCGSFVPALYFIGTVSSGPFFYTDNSRLTGCVAAMIRSDVGIRHNNALNPFPGEFRPIGRMDSIVITLPVGVSFSPSIPVKYRTTKWTNKYVETGVIQTIANPVINGQKLSFVNDGSWNLSGFNTNIPQTMASLLFYVVADCQVPATTGSLPLTIDAYGATYVYNNPVAAPAYSGTATQNNMGILSVDGTQRGTLTVQNNSGVLQGTKAQHFWDVQLSSTGTATVPYVWLALEKTAASGIRVDSVVLKPSNEVLSPLNYGSTGSKWYKVSSAGLASGVSQQARVYFQYTNCSNDSILLKGGWNCTGYPDADPSAYACTPAQTYLSLMPQPSQVQLSVARQPGGGSSINLCTTDSALLVLNSAQSANLIAPYITFFPPAGLSLVTPIQVEYPRASGNYQDAGVSSLPGGGYKIDLSAHTAIGNNGMLGTANANPSYSPLGADREAKIKVNFTTDCAYSSGTSLQFNAYGNRPCGAPATDNGIAATTSALNITGASAPGGAGISISFGSVSSANCGTSLTVALSTTPTSVGTSAGDTMVYTLPVSLAYAGGLSSGFNAFVSGGKGAPTIVKVAMPVGSPASTAINYSFNVVPAGEGCGSTTISGAYQRNITPLNCNGTPCPGSRVIIASGNSGAITLNKPSVTITDLAIDSAKWVAGQYQNVYLKYRNDGSAALPARVDSVEFFCGSSTTPFAVRALGKALAIGASDSEKYWVFIPKGVCAMGSLVTARVQTHTAAGTAQCLCSPSSMQLAGVPLPLHFLSQALSTDQCAVRIDWTYNSTAPANIGFRVERSRDGQRYETLATVAPTTTTYTDVVPQAGNWYYRLNALVPGTEGVFSPVLQATTQQCTGSSVRIYPNPAATQVQVVLQGDMHQVRYVLSDALGKTVLSGSLESKTANSLDISALPAGIYLLRVLSNEVTTVEPLQIRK